LPYFFDGFCLQALEFGGKLLLVQLSNQMIFQDTKKPVFSFENKHGSYVSDISWSPVHPAAFVSSSLTGTLSVWNLNTDVEDPLAIQSSGNAIYRSIWSSNGRQIATLDENGVVQLYNVHESLYNVKASEWDTLSRYAWFYQQAYYP
jgi:WD40 repeat protein